MFLGARAVELGLFMAARHGPDALHADSCHQAPRHLPSASSCTTWCSSSHRDDRVHGRRLSAGATRPAVVQRVAHAVSPAVREGRDSRLDGEYPTEVQPLVQRSERAARAIAKQRVDARADEGRRSRARTEDAADAAQPAGGAREGRRTRSSSPPRSRSRSSACAGRWITTSRTRARRRQAAIRPRAVTC